MAKTQEERISELEQFERTINELRNVIMIMIKADQSDQLRWLSQIYHLTIEAKSQFEDAQG